MTKKTVLIKHFAFKFLFIFWLFSQPLNAAEFYAILIGDTSEKTIAKLVRSDIKRMRAEVKQIAKLTGQNLHLALLQGDNLSPENLLSVLDELEPGIDDTVLFYQSSHGFRTPEHEGRWPILFFSAHHLGIPFEAINEFLLSKKQRLLISIVNACNSPLPKKFIHHKQSLGVVNRSKSWGIESSEVYKKLFVESRGAIIASSSKSGQQSFGLDIGGSFFTASFLDILNKALRGEVNANWDDVMMEVVKDTKRRGQAYNCSQRPQYMIIK